MDDSSRRFSEKTGKKNANLVRFGLILVGFFKKLAENGDVDEKLASSARNWRNQLVNRGFHDSVKGG
ncbi:hypothetical protein [Rhizobium sp. BK491]|uniref:hypothetical protein n=1 Tax=Rhizobium sp. BK491 TaxID=2587009 RepID=UPI00160C4C9D|nr:hypothetical protein [Rhizobium sp. BK491]MBB3570840.1 hypothetical protein [Rhizobium sp. BK491]